MVRGEQVFHLLAHLINYHKIKDIIKKHASRHIWCCRKEDSIFTIPQPRQSSTTNILDNPEQLHIKRHGVFSNTVPGDTLVTV
jgi:hypothetical protein